jgi:hypothetical protein
VVHIVTAVAAVKRLTVAPETALGLTSFYPNGDLLGSIAQAAFKCAHVWSVLPRYHTCKHHRSVAFRAWRSFNFNGAEISVEELWHVLLA